MEKNNYSPGILQYIPFFYVIWSDDLLSVSEIAVIRKAIDTDESLTKEDKATLKGWLDKDAPPPNTEIKTWKQTISNAKVKLVESDTYPIIYSM